MAYRNFDEPGNAALLQPPFVSAPVARMEAPGFSPREWTIIRLAREDGLSSLRYEETALARLVRLIFGIERKTPLADPRLEALRRIAVLAWQHGYNVGATDIAAFLSAGYSLDQYEAVLAHIGLERAASPQRTRFQGARR